MPAAPAGGFPQTPPRRAGIITQSIDDTLVTPSAHMTSAVIGRDLEPQLRDRSRLRRPLRPRHAGPSRHRDAAQPGRPASRTDYFTAAQAIIRAAQAAGIGANSAAGPTPDSPAIAYWENLFPGAAGGGLTATQAITRAFMQNGPDWITALYDMDTSCAPACSKFGPYAYFAEQYDSLAAISSIGRVELQRHDADAAQPLLGRHAVRHQLHAVEVRRHGLAGRARQRLRQLSPTAATPAS